MSHRTLGLGIVGCGDFLRWQEGTLTSSRAVKVQTVFDLDAPRAAKWAAKLGARTAGSLQQVAADPQVDVMVLLVPPWARKDAVLTAAQAGKHILTTKPLAPDAASCDAMVAAVETAGVRCGVIYNRTGNAEVESLKAVFDSGQLGRLAIYKQDWIHHYPQWNAWATDPERNGGPFMDAMIHNLNTARYLMDSPAVAATFFSDNHAHAATLRCSDTEMLKLDFASGGAAHLFITWAADLAVFGTEGNDREHVDQFFLVTDQGWRLTRPTQSDRAPVGDSDAPAAIVASRLGEKRAIPLVRLPQTPYDQFADAIAGNGPLPSGLVSLRDAADDIRLIRRCQQSLGTRVDLTKG